ncbi:MAG: DUF104 domain-containing protein [Candidatus Methanofastidiosum sp.]|nr:DUF104 domain-containing protein [Methanofastidiosum sp.]
MSIIVHAKVEKGVLKPLEDISKLGIEDGEVILEIKTPKYKTKNKELFRQSINASNKIIDEVVDLDIDLLVD